MSTSFARREQRSNGGLYLRGLMLDGRRKSMVPMAERLQVDHQRLQQFITSSTWDYVAVRRRLAQRAITVVAPEAWVLDDTGHVKDGDASPHDHVTRVRPLIQVMETGRWSPAW
ncbi:transposase [Streptosporangium canum]